VNTCPPQEETDVHKPDLAVRTRLKIIEAAMRLYAEKGYYQASAREVAREAGVSPATFYFYFRNKRELFAEMILFVIDDFKNATRAEIEREENVFGRALIMFQTFYRNYPKVGEVFNQLRAGTAANDPWAKTMFKKVLDDLTGDISMKIDDAIEHGILREVDSLVLAYIMTVLAEASFQYASLNSQYDAEQIGYFVIDWLFNGLDPRLRRD
jgi:AcrR family transcriptional regulator